MSLEASVSYSLPILVPFNLIFVNAGVVDWSSSLISVWFACSGILKSKTPTTPTLQCTNAIFGDEDFSLDLIKLRVRDELRFGSLVVANRVF